MLSIAFTTSVIFSEFWHWKSWLTSLSCKLPAISKWFSFYIRKIVNEPRHQWKFLSGCFYKFKCPPRPNGTQVRVKNWFQFIRSIWDFFRRWRWTARGSRCSERSGSTIDTFFTSTFPETAAGPSSRSPTSGARTKCWASGTQTGPPLTSCRSRSCLALIKDVGNKSELQTYQSVAFLSKGYSCTIAGYFF